MPYQEHKIKQLSYQYPISSLLNLTHNGNLIEIKLIWKCNFYDAFITDCLLTISYCILCKLQNYVSSKLTELFISQAIRFSNLAINYDIFI